MSHRSRSHNVTRVVRLHRKSVRASKLGASMSNARLGSVPVHREGCTLCSDSPLVILSRT